MPTYSSTYWQNATQIKYWYNYIVQSHQDCCLAIFYQLVVCMASSIQILIRLIISYEQLFWVLEFHIKFGSYLCSFNMRFTSSMAEFWAGRGWGTLLAVQEGETHLDTNTFLWISSYVQIDRVHLRMLVVYVCHSYLTYILRRKIFAQLIFYDFFIL